MDRRPWFERFADLAEWEFGRFAANEFPATIDESARAEGRFVVRTKVRFRESDHDMEVRYPSETPELPPVVFGPPGLLDRHQNPFEGNFCLLERPLDDWKAQQWGAADLIAERLTALLSDSEEGPEAVRAGEAPMPEPFTAYYRTSLGPVVLVPGALLSPPGNGGTARLRLFDPNSLRYLLIEVEGKDSAVPVLDIFSQGSEITAKWKRLKKPPPVPDAPSLVEWVRANHSDLLSPTLPAKLANSRHVKRPKSELVGLLFSEEGPEVGEERDAWIFLFVPQGAPPHLIEHQVVSLEERQRRIPSQAPLVDRSVVVVGLGALGGPVATELAKCGVGNLEVVDFDSYDINNSVRHVLTTDWSGLPKTLGIGALSRRFNPFCVVTEHLLRFGDADWKGQSSLERFEEMVGRADLVIETTGSHQLQHFIGRVCFESGKPFISCWLTDGYLGGHIVRIVPGETCCYLCYATVLANKELPLAEASENASVTAQGCSHPTTTGAGFDAAELAAIASRLAVQTMLHELDVHDHIVVNFYRDGKDVEIPRFFSERLGPTDGCDRCGRHAGFTEALAVTS